MQKSHNPAVAPKPLDTARPRAVVIDCTGQGIATVEAKVYGPDNAILASGGPWDCGIGQGTVASVPAGSNRTVVILGRDAAKNVVFHGRKSDLQVAADSVTQAGTIECNTFCNAFTSPGRWRGAGGGRRGI